MCRTVLALALIAAAPATAAERFAGTWATSRTNSEGLWTFYFFSEYARVVDLRCKIFGWEKTRSGYYSDLSCLLAGEASTSKIEVTQGSETPHINMDGLVATVQRCEATSLPAQADTPGAGAHLTIDGLFRVGRTGINCYREPCPRVGIVPAYPDGRPSARRPVYSGATAPPLVGHLSDQRRIKRAWADQECLLVEGRLRRSPDSFEVFHVLREC